MIKLVLSREQAQAVANTTETIEFYDQDGKPLGVYSVVCSGEEFRIAKERLKAGGPTFTTEQVLNRLRELETQ